MGLNPTQIVVHNIDDDHLDYFKDIEHIYSAFAKFVSLLPEDGMLFCCGDDPLVKRLHDDTIVKKFHNKLPYKSLY